MAGNKVHLSQIDERNLLIATDADILGAGGTLISDIVHVSGYTHITGFAYSDVDSAAGGLIIEQALQESDFPGGTAATTHVTVSNFSIAGTNITDNAVSVQIVAPFVRRGL